jgi:1-acyl-sn-glycerol-3-phosphate acyltransferase
MRHPTFQQDKAFYGLPFTHWFVYRATWCFMLLMRILLFRTKTHGREKLPKREPYLLLANHTTALDPFLAGSPIRRPIRFMGSTALFSVPFLGKYLSMLGTFPKMKFIKDKSSMEALQAHYDRGFVVCLFPEGGRSWNGRTSMVLPGIGRLIKRMGAKVVYAKIHNAYTFQPRWARYPRWVPIEIRYSGPFEYGDRSVEEINSDVQRQLECPPLPRSSARTFGFRMAEGLSEYLWACPSCFEMEALEIDRSNGNAVVCRQCCATWTVDTYTHLSGTSELTVAEAFDLISAHFGRPPMMDKALFNASGVVLQAEMGKVIAHPQNGKSELVAAGLLQIHSNGLRILGQEREIWSTAFSELGAISVEIGNRLQFRIDGMLYQVVVKGESSLKWDHFLRSWQSHLQGQPY